METQKKDIQNEHMKKRCYIISIMFYISLYNWYNYSLFDPINNSFYTLYYQNSLLMILYLIWDTYNMIIRPILYRTDLMIHHFISLIVYFSFFNKTSLQMSNVLIMESISLMNYLWRNNPNLLKLYRIFCIISIRIPLSLYMWLYYNPNIIYPYWKITFTYKEYLYLSILGNIYSFFILYDIYILWKIYKK